jgi:hypothetical protein
MRVAIMQPYFMPYVGYFRLLAATDFFVAYDCVQFPRRGWVHRNQLTNASGNTHWLTLPLRRADRDTTRIVDLEFPEDAQTRWEAQFARFPALQQLQKRGGDLAAAVLRLDGSPAHYILNALQTAARMLRVETPIVRSSALSIDPALKGQERILAICKKLGATSYINAPGGTALYEPTAFQRQGLQLRFLSEYRGPFVSVLERLVNEDPNAISAEMTRNMVGFQSPLSLAAGPG